MVPMRRALWGALVPVLVLAGSAHAVVTHRVIFIGDSLTANEALFAHEMLPERVGRALGPRILAQSVASPGATMTPYGYSVGFASQGSLVSLVSGLFVPKAVVILLGTNDYDINDVGVSADMFRAAYSIFLGSVPKNLPVVCVTPPWYVNEAAPNAAGNTLEDFRAVIRQVCASQTIVEGVNAIPHDLAYYVDGRHPNNRGTVLLARAVAAALKPIVAQ